MTESAGTQLTSQPNFFLTLLQTSKYLVPANGLIASAVAGGTPFVYRSALFRFTASAVNHITDLSFKAVPFPLNYVTGTIGLLTAHEAVPLNLVHLQATAVTAVVMLATTITLNVIALKVFKVKPPTEAEHKQLALQAHNLIPAAPPTALVPFQPQQPPDSPRVPTPPVLPQIFAPAKKVFDTKAAMPEAAPVKAIQVKALQAKHVPNYNPDSYNNYYNPDSNNFLEPYDDIPGICCGGFLGKIFALFSGRH